MSRSKGSATELLQAIVDDVGDADDLKGVTASLRSAVRDLLRHNASSLPQAAAFFSSPEGAIVLLVARPASTLRFFAALLNHTNTQIWKCLDPNGVHGRRFVEDKVALGQAWDLVMESILLGLKAFLDPTEARAKPLTARDEDLLGMICYASLARLLTTDHVFSAVKRRILDIFEDSTHLCMENKNRLIRPELLGPKRLAGLISVAEDHGVTSRALELAFRLRSHLARAPSSAGVSTSSWEAALFPSGVFGPEESQKLRGMFHRLKAREWDEGSLSLLQELSALASNNFKLVFAVTFHVNGRAFLCTDVEKPTEDYQDFVGFNRRSISANVLSYLADDDGAQRTIEAPLSGIKSVELFDFSEDYMTCRIILSHSPTLESTPLELPHNEADPSLVLGIRLSDAQRLQQVLMMRKTPYNTRAAEQADVMELDTAHAKRRKAAEEPPRTDEPSLHPIKYSASSLRGQSGIPTSSPDLYTPQRNRAGPKRVPRKASELGAGTKANRQTVGKAADSDTSSDLPMVARPKTPSPWRDVAPPKQTRHSQPPQPAPKRKSSSRQKMPWDDDTPGEKTRNAPPEHRNESALSAHEDWDMGGIEPNFDPGPRLERQGTEVEDDREVFQEVTSHGALKVDQPAPRWTDQSREEAPSLEEKELIRHAQSPIAINEPVHNIPFKKNLRMPPSLLTSSKAPSPTRVPRPDPIAASPLDGPGRSPLAPLAFAFRHHNSASLTSGIKAHSKIQTRGRTPAGFGQTPPAKRARLETGSAPREHPEAMQRDEQQSEDVLVDLARIVLRKHQLRTNEQTSSLSRSRPAITAAARHAAREMQEMTVSIASAAHQLSRGSAHRFRDFDSQTRSIRSKALRAVEMIKKRA
ncbi:BZ3500_MvSof-1268-A1-R1_Chr4-1g06725 [Microbotryum saponariae]|uniref:BZ3500_MvSof-1268-A1-R1_Chr4-1g06725 protein n=1 Tax=Microbotryum saponariae TaxID=289078 RepID=A0A2X0LM83_9BASI|nr:BZ3500_MvSof-1268-A1-R1_Chr4-1g06725 [Microbotryum saponariae]SDA06390.1 BZ3501_MvSof-1269-A2-R1_Chr4-1g06435 [Microbotryum saponariae]